MIKIIKYTAVTLIAVGAASCNSADDSLKAPVSPEKYICFGVPEINVNATVDDFAGSTGSRAAHLTNTLENFQVWGFCAPNDLSGNINTQVVDQTWNDKSVFFTTTPDVFNNKKITVSNGFANYEGEKQEWSGTADARYTFVAAYTPSGTFAMGSGSVTAGSEHGPRLKFTMPRTSTDKTTLLYPADQPDALVAARFNHQQADGRVDLSFFHFMTGLRFKFHNHTADKDLVIKRVTFQGIFHKEATFDFTKDKPVMTVAGTYAGTFVLFDSATGQTISHGTADYMGGNELPVTFLMLPNPDGTIEADGKFTLGSEKEIRITYSLGGGEDKTFIHGNNFTLNYTPQPNTLHTAHFNFVGDDFVVFFQADDEKNWQNGSDNDVIIH
ncbi:MAG: fimbrillin family protein [Muribaculaceae bacterium]|nr:fimbrillin family protein [Muribaculaceae bacterium]